MVLKSLVKTNIVCILSCCFLSACIKSPKQISQKQFLEENRYQSFESWKNWYVTHRPTTRYYIAFYDTLGIYTDTGDSEKLKKRISRFIFFEENNTFYIRLTTGDTLSTTLTLDNFIQDSIWIKNYNQINPDDLIKNVCFVLQYDFGIREVEYTKSPERVSFQGDSIDLIYFFNPTDSGFKGYQNQITSHWYSSH